MASRASTGLLVLSTSFRALGSQVYSLLELVNTHVKNTLYIHLQPVKHEPLLQFTPLQSSVEKFAYTELVSLIYSSAHNVCHMLDVRILLDHVKASGIQSRRTTKKQFDIILTNHKTADVKHFLKTKFYQNVDNIPIVQLPIEIDLGNSEETVTGRGRGSVNNTLETKWKDYQSVVLGGTFDRLHAGHKILLSEALMRCYQQLTVGVTDDVMIKSKVLYELIEPISTRINAIENFLEDVEPNVTHLVVPISNPFGPSTVDPNLQCIIVSEETAKGGKLVNEERKRKKLCDLDLHMIKIFPDDYHSKEEEMKISSSSLRMRTLGKRLRNPTPKSDIPTFPYVIGLTGGIASGKSSIAKRLEKLGMATIHSDQLAHLAYLPGTNAYLKIITEFGSEIVNPDNLINRKKLGGIVFSNPQLLDKLNKIVWPEVERLIKQEILLRAKMGKRFVLVEVPVLIESGLTRLVHEVWVSIIPKEEAVRRIVARDSLSTEQAEQRVASQISNEARVAAANVVLSTLWEPEFTQKQVEIAWSELNKYLSENNVQ